MEPLYNVADYVLLALMAACMAALVFFGVNQPAHIKAPPPPAPVVEHLSYCPSKSWNGLYMPCRFLKWEGRA